MKAILKQAFDSQKCVRLFYDGHVRIVEVHTCGNTTAGHDAVRVYQTSGGSVSGEVPGWKMLLLSEMSGASISDEDSAAPRAGYKRGDKGMRTIYFQV